jgi:type II secretory pathway component PulJ
MFNLLIALALLAMILGPAIVALVHHRRTREGDL